MAEESRRPIVLLQPHLKFGGAENQTVLIANRIVAGGDRCVVILHRRTGGFLPELDPRVEVLDLRFESHGAIMFGAVRALLKLRAIKPRLIIVRLWSSIMLVGLIRPFLQGRVVFVEDLDPRSHRDFIRFGAIKQAVIRLVFRRQRGDLVANSRHVAQAMASVYGLAKEPRVIHCGVDPERVLVLSRRPAARPVPQTRALRVVTVGSLVERKGVRQVFRALADFDQAIQWIVVGEGPLGDWLREQSSNVPHLDLQLVGAQANPFPYIAAADVMVHGAQSESLGLVILEALALGTPVAAHEANGPREIAAVLNTPQLRLFDVSRPETLNLILRDVEGRARERQAVDLGPFLIENCVESLLALGVDHTI